MKDQDDEDDQEKNDEKDKAVNDTVTQQEESNFDEPPADKDKSNALQNQANLNQFLHKKNEVSKKKTKNKNS